MKLRNTFLVLGFSLLTGCATIMSGGTQNVGVKAVDATTNRPVPNVVCQAHDSKGMSYTVNGNPGTTLVTRGQGVLRIDCHGQGYAPSEVSLRDGFNAWTLGNIIFWPGIIVDAVSGAAEKYPSDVTVMMTPKSIHV